MARTTKQLSAAEVKNAKAMSGKQTMLFDGGGLFLLVKSGGSKGWRFKFRLDGKDKLMSFGTYPEVSLADARDKRSAARKLVEQGINPIQVRADEKKHRKNVLDNTFEKVSFQWLAMQRNLADSTKKLIERRLERDICPAIGKKPISEIRPRMILNKVIRPMELRGAVVLSKRAKSIISQVFCYAIAEEYVESDPTRDITRAMMQVVAGHRAAIIDPAELAKLLKAVDEYSGSYVVKCALQLLPMLFVRPGELRSMRWVDIDLKATEWCFTAAKTKKDMVVPLSRQAVEVLESLQPLTGHMVFCFPSIRSAARPISDNTLNAAFRRMDFDKDTVTAHGFRATARTILDEVLQQRVDLIEHQLGHNVRDANGVAYNRTSHLPARCKMMQLWADYLDGLKNDSAKVIPLRSNKR